MALDDRIAAFVTAVAEQFNSLTGGAYSNQMYVLETTEDASDVPVDFPVGGIILRKTP